MAPMACACPRRGTSRRYTIAKIVPLAFTIPRDLVLAAHHGSERQPVCIHADRHQDQPADRELVRHRARERLATDPQAANDSGVGSRTNEKWRGTPPEDARERLLVISNLLPQRIRQLRIRVLRDAP